MTTPPIALGVVPTPGQVTVAAAEAMRLFAGERWPEAIDALQRVADGSTGDDEGNRQIAQLDLAVAQFHARRYRDAAGNFRAIAANNLHLKQREGFVGLCRLAAEPELQALVQPSDFASRLYDLGYLARFDNNAQRGIYEIGLYFTGVTRMRMRQRDEARALFERVAPDGPYGAAAAKCLQVLGHR